jgi:MFS family permease
MAGSILGGRLSDRALRINTEKNNGQKADPEVRIMSVRLPMLLSPATFVGYAWSAHYKTNIAIPIVCLVLLGFSLFWIYSSTLSYLIDSNVGRSSGAVACNSAIRGLFAFVASEVAGPLQDSVGDGPLYTGWAILLGLGQIGLLSIAYKGKQWRDPDWKWPRMSIRK